MMQVSRSNEADFGEVVLRARATAADRGLFLLTLLMTLVITGGVIWYWTNRSANAPAPGLGVVLVPLLMAAGLGALSWVRLVRCCVVHELCERGVRVRWGARTLVSIAYADVERFQLDLAQHVTHGVPAGTVLSFVIADGGKRRVRYTGAYSRKTAERDAAALPARYAGEAAIDVARRLVSKHVAKRMSQALAKDGSVVWGAVARLSARGVTPVAVLREKPETPYAQVGMTAMGAGTYELFRSGEQKSFLKLALSEENFWPGLMLFEALLQQHRGAGATVRREPTSV